jgi:rare lipoprotein A
MTQHKKTALVLRLAALAISIPLVPAARAADDLAVAEPTVAAQPIPVEEAIDREEAAAVVDTIAEEEKSDLRESDSAAAALIPTLVCWTSAELDELAIPDQAFSTVASADTIIGIASFYDEPQWTASGEPFNPNAFTAAAQLEIRHKFGGIRFGVKYRPAYAVVQYGSKKLILKFNDVGPLRPGRIVDLSRAAMAYFNGLKKGLLRNVKVTPLPLGKVFTPGPVTDAQLAALGIGNIGNAVATAQAAITPKPGAAAPEAPVSASAEAVSISARLYALETVIGES